MMLLLMFMEWLHASIAMIFLNFSQTTRICKGFIHFLTSPCYRTDLNTLIQDFFFLQIGIMMLFWNPFDLLFFGQ